MIAFYITIVFHVFFVVTIIFVLLFQSWSHSLITEKSLSKETKMSVLDSTCSARLEGGTLAPLDTGLEATYDGLTLTTDNTPGHRAIKSVFCCK